MVLFASYSSALGGAERLLIDWATGLEGEVCLACPPGGLASAAGARGIRVFPLRERRLTLRVSAWEPLAAAGRLAAHGRELRRLVAQLDPELLVLWGMRSALAWSSAPQPGGERRRVVFHHNDFLPGPVIGQLVRAVAARADLITVPARAVARDLDPAGRLGQRLQVVHPGVDVGRFDPTTEPAQPPEVLVLGALVSWKRPELALEACAIARRQIAGLRVRLVGGPVSDDGRLLAALRARAGQPDLAGAVEFTGPVGDPAPELARASCLLHAAVREPFGLAVLETMAAGRPVVLPDQGGPVEIADQTCALFYPAGDAAAAGEAVARVLSDPGLGARLGAAGRARAEQYFQLQASQAGWRRALEGIRRGHEPAPSGPRLGIVTVTHNSEAVIGRLLTSVQRHLPEASVVVVDCASTDGTVDAARGYAGVRVLALEENLGFGRACNLGLGEVSAPVTALLNPDVELLDDSLRTLVAEAQRPPERLLAPLVLNPDGRTQDTVHPAPGSTAELMGGVLPYTLLPGRLAAPLAPWRQARPRRVGWAVGCAIVAQTETLRQLGPFDSRFFLYGEDLDLGLRGTGAGVQTWFWPSGRVIHLGAHAVNGAFGGEPFELLAQGRREALSHNGGSRRLALDDAAQLLRFGTRLAAKRMLGMAAERERRQLEALVAARRTSHNR